MRLTAIEFSELKDISPNGVARAIREGRLNGVKVEGRWEVIMDDKALAYQPDPQARQKYDGAIEAFLTDPSYSGDYISSRPVDLGTSTGFLNPRRKTPVGRS